jgi:dGTPase
MPRETRRHDIQGGDQRKEFQRDRDRILYSSHFRRLAGVTQVANASEGHFFHNRLLHTLKVAQVGRRIAESLVAGDPNIPIDADVVETASLAHDLGHPPFGHAGESALSECIEKAGDLEGFDGNAQTFRILTRLAVRDDDCTGLNLTRASLAATIKYPWVRDLADPQSYKHKNGVSTLTILTSSRSLWQNKQSVNARLKQP